VNAWLHSRYHPQGFGFYDHGSTFENFGVLGPDGSHLTKRGFFANRMTTLDLMGGRGWRCLIPGNIQGKVG